MVTSNKKLVKSHHLLHAQTVPIVFIGLFDFLDWQLSFRLPYWVLRVTGVGAAADCLARRVLKTQPPPARAFAAVVACTAADGPTDRMLRWQLSLRTIVLCRVRTSWLATPPRTVVRRCMHRAHYWCMEPAGTLASHHHYRAAAAVLY